MDWLSHVSSSPSMWLLFVAINVQTNTQIVDFGLMLRISLFRLLFLDKAIWKEQQESEFHMFIIFCSSWSTCSTKPSLALDCLLICAVGDNVHKMTFTLNNEWDKIFISYGGYILTLTFTTLKCHGSCFRWEINYTNQKPFLISSYIEMLSFRESEKIKSIFHHQFLSFSMYWFGQQKKLTISKVCSGDSVDFAPFNFYFAFNACK